jgi:hypothetical protein
MMLWNPLVKKDEELCSIDPGIVILLRLICAFCPTSAELPCLDCGCNYMTSSHLIQSNREES